MRFPLLSIFLLLTFFTGSLSAATLTWNGGTSTAWGTATNWTPNQVPTTGDTLVITGTGANRPTNQNIAGLSLVALQFNNTSTTAITITGSAVTLTSAATALLVDAASANHTLSFDLVLGSNQTWDVGAGRILTVTSAVTETGGARTLTKTGTGRVTFNNATITLTGDVLANGGGASTVEFTGTTTLTAAQLRASSANTGNTILIGGTSVINVGNLFLGENTGFAGTCTQSGGTVTVTGHVRVGHFPTETSVYNISAGSLTITTVSATNPFGGAEINGALYVGVDGTGTFNQSGGTVTTPALVLDNRGDTTGTDSYVLTGGVINIGTWGIQGNGTSQMDLSNGTVVATASWTGTRTIRTTSNNSPIFDTGTNNVTLSGAVIATSGTNTGQFTKAGTGTLTFSGANDNASLRLNVTAGTAILGKASTTAIHACAGVFGVSAGAFLELGGTGTDQIFDGATWGLFNMNGTFNLNGRNENVDGFTGTGTILNNGAAAATMTAGQSGGSGTFDGVMQSGTQPLAFAKNGAGILTLTNTHTYTGATTVNTGVLRLRGNTGVLTATSGLTVGGAAFEIDATAGGNPNRLPDAAPVTLNAGSSFQMTAPLDESRTETIGALAFNDQSQIVLNATSNTAGQGDARLIAAAITTTGAQVLMRTGTGTASGEFGNLLSASSSVVGVGPGSITVYEQNGSFGRIASGIYDPTEGVIASGTATSTIYTSVASGNWDDVTKWTPTPPAGGPGAADSVIILNNHNISLNGADRAISSVTFNALVPGNGQISGANTLTIGSGGITVNASNNPTPTIACNVDLGGAARTITVNSTNGTGLVMSGSISNGSLVKLGAANGTLALNGNNNFTGGVVHSAGFILAGSSTALGTVAGTFRMNLIAKRLLLANGVNIANPIVVDVANPDANRGVFEGPGTGSATLSGVMTINAAAASGGHFYGGTGLVLAGPINSSFTLAQRDLLVTYSGGGTYPALIITGTANLGAVNGICPTATVSVGFSGTGIFNLNGFNQTLGGLVFGAGGIGTVNTGANTLTVNGDFASSGNFAHVLNGAVDLGGASRTFNIADSTVAVDLNVNAAIANGSLVKNGAGNLQLSGVNTYAGTTTVDLGTLTLAGNVGTIATSSAIVVNSGVLEINGTAGGNPDRIGNAVPVTVGAGGVLQMTAPVDETRTESIGALTLNDQAQVVMNANSTATLGDARLTATTITVNGTAALLRRALGTITTEFGNLLSGAGALAGAGVINVTELSNTTGTSGAGVYNATEGVVVGGAAVATYTSAASGNWDVPATWIPASPAGGPVATDYVIIAAAHNVALNGNRAARGVTFLGAGTISGANTLTVGNGGITVVASGSPLATISSLLDLGGAANTISVQGSSTLTISNAISNGGLVKTGTGLLALTSAVANTYAGNTVINGGVLSFTADNQLGAVPAAATPGNIVINNATLRTGTTLTLSANRGLAIGPTTGSGSGTIDVTVNTLTYNGIIANNGGTGSLVKAGAGLLALAGAAANTYAGPTVINGGALSFTNDNQLGAVPPAPTPGNIVINNAQLRTGSNVTINVNRGIAIGPVTGPGPGTLDITGNTTIYDGVIANRGGVGELIKTGGGTLQLGGTNTFTGNISSTGGTLSVAADGNFGNGSRIDITGGTLLARATFTINAARAIGLGGTAGNALIALNVSGTNTLTFNGVVDDRFTGIAHVQKLGTGRLSLGGSNLLAGEIDVEQGTWTATSASALGNSAVQMRVLTGTTLELTLTGSVVKPIFIAGTLLATGNVNLSGGIALTGNTTVNVVNAADVLTLNGNIESALNSTLTFTGSGAAIVNGVVASAQVPVVSNIEGRYFDVAPDLFLSTVAGINNVSFTLAPTTTRTLASARLSYPDDATFIALFGAQTTNSSFTAVFLGDLTVPSTGVYNVSNYLNDDEALTWIDVNQSGTFDTGEMIVRAGGFNDNFSVGSVTLSAGTSYKFASAVRDTGGGGALIARFEKNFFGRPLLSRQSVIVNETNPGTNSLTKTGTGTVTLNADNTFTGNVLVQNGVLALGHTNALGAVAKTVTVMGDAATSLLPEMRLSGGIDPAVTTLVVSGNGVAGSGVVRSVTGANSISATNITMTSGNGGTTFGVDAGTLTVNGALSANVTARTLALVGAGNGILNGTITDGTTVGLPVSKAGAGTWTLNGASTYTGATTVTAGTLVAANTTGSATGTGETTVALGATLAGTGSLGGNVIVNGTVAPGVAGIGNLTFGAAATFNAGSTFAVELNGAANDRLTVGGAVTLSNPALNLSATGTSHPQAFMILDRQLAGPIAGTFNGLANGATIVSGRTFVVRYDFGDGNDCHLIDNTPPAFTAATTNTSQTVDENTALTALAATDADSDALTFSVVSGTLPSGVTALNADGTFAGIPDYASAGTYNLQVRVADAFGGFATINLTINVLDFGFSISDVTVNETAGTATLVVTRSGQGSQAATLDVATQNGTATAGADYTTFGTTLSWGVGDTTSRNVVVTILNDTLSEGSEVFQAVLSNASAGAINKAIGVVTITDDEALPTLAITGVTVAESAGTATLTVTMNGQSANPITVDYTTVNGTALGGLDFTATTGTLTWAALDNTPKTFTVAITDDVIFDPNESFTVNLVNVSPSALIQTGTATVAITDNDVPPAAVNDSATVGQNLPLAINVLANDTGLTNLPVTVTIVTPPANGTVSVNADSTVTYAPALNYTGPDSFVYQLRDSAGQTSQATVSVTVKPAPVITSQPTITPNPAVVGTPVLASVAFDVGTVAWVWGDGTTGAGSNLTHTYTSAGNYTVVVTATSPEGLTTTATVTVLVGFGLIGGDGLPGGGATPPGVTGILIGGAGAGAAQGGSGKITCNYVRRDKTTYQGSIGALALPTTMTQADLAMLPGGLVIGTGASAATFRFDLDKRGRGRATGLPLVEFNVKKGRFKFKAQRSDLTDLTEALGGTREFTPKASQPVTLLVPVTLLIGNKVFLAMTFQVKYKQINGRGKGGL